MNKILVFIDLTETAEKSVQQAISLAKRFDKSIEFCHIEMENNNGEEALNDALIKASEAGVSSKWVMLKGDFYEVAPAYIEENPPFLVVVGTHGKKGLRQNIFGSNIFRFVSSFKAPALVLSDFSEITDGGFQKILLRVASHANYLDKVKAACNLLNRAGKILLLNLRKPGAKLAEAVTENIKQSQKYLAEEEVPYEIVGADAEHFSVGYSKGILSYAKQNEVDLIAIFTHVAEESFYFGKIDKENLMINKEGIQVLCVG
jgi:nucleotide-binding universal stress UspA family protein